MVKWYQGLDHCECMQTMHALDNFECHGIPQEKTNIRNAKKKGRNLAHQICVGILLYIVAFHE